MVELCGSTAIQLASFAAIYLRRSTQFSKQPFYSASFHHVHRFHSIDRVFVSSETMVMMVTAASAPASAAAAVLTKDIIRRAW